VPVGATSSYVISILFHHYKELKECINQVEQIKDRFNSSKNQRLMKEMKKEEEEEQTTQKK
jgi:hypothetical protein